METWRTDWAVAKRDLALKLATGECGGSYAEAALILCSAISALAAEVWPGRNKDRFRYIEALKNHVSSTLETTKISIPLLVESLEKISLRNEATLQKNAFLQFDSSRVLSGAEVDRFEVEILKICPGLSLASIRKCSYASLLYEELRSGYVHQYQPGEHADSLRMTGLPVAVSYVNFLIPPYRRIHLSPPWIANILVDLAETLDKVSSTLPLNDPPDWWITGS